MPTNGFVDVYFISSLQPPQPSINMRIVMSIAFVLPQTHYPITYACACVDLLPEKQSTQYFFLYVPIIIQCAAACRVR